MKPRLLLGLGNDLAGDDGVGLRVAERLRGDPRLPDDVDIRLAGTDLFDAHAAMRDRQHVIFVDAVLGPEPTGTVLVLDPADPLLADQGASVHQLSPTAALATLRAVDPELRDVPVTLIGVVVDGVRVRAGLSPDLARCIDEIAAQVCDELARPPRRGPTA